MKSHAANAKAWGLSRSGEWGVSPRATRLRTRAKGRYELPGQKGKKGKAQASALGDGSLAHLEC